MNAVMRSILFWIIFILLLVASGFLSNSFLPPTQSRIGYGILGTLAALLVTWVFLKAEKQSFQSINLVWDRITLPRFFVGLVIGSLIFGLIVLALILFSDIRFKLNLQPFHVSILIPYLVFIPLALMEEIGFRAYPFLRLNKASGILLTQIIVAIAFAVYHVINGWSVEAAFLGTFVWAWVFGLAAIWSGGIAVPTGLHVAINIIPGLIGLKGTENSIWVIDYGNHAQEVVIASADKIGLIMQIVILISTIALTQFYNRRRQSVATKR